MKKMLLMLLSLLLIVACGDKRSSEGIDKERLTVQVLQKNVNGELRSKLVMCDGKECRNALREQDGDEFYFFYEDTDRHNRQRENRRRNVNRSHHQVHQKHHDFADRGRLGSSQYIGSDYDRPHVGVSFVNGRLNLRYRYQARTSYRVRATYSNHHSNRHYDTGVRRSKRRDNDDYADTVGTVAERADLMHDIAEDRLWEERERSLRKLFVQGEAIRVNKDELRRLLVIVADYFDVEIDRKVEKTC